MKKSTPFKRLKMYVGAGKDSWNFKTLEEAQEYIRKNNTPDYIGIDNILYTMEEYDNDGKEISYYNLRTNNRLEVITENRYQNGFKDAELTIYENYGAWRNDISYAD